MRKLSAPRLRKVEPAGPSEPQEHIWGAAVFPTRGSEPERQTRGHRGIDFARRCSFANIRHIGEPRVVQQGDHISASGPIGGHASKAERLDALATAGDQGRGRRA